MKPAYFGQCSCCMNIDKNNYHKETELDTNLSLTLVQTLTLPTGERSFGHFTSSRCYETTVFNFVYMDSPYNLGWDPESVSEIHFRRKILIAWIWRIENKNTGNRFCRK